VILLFIMPSLSLFVLKSMGMLSMRRFGPDGFFRSKIHLIDDLDQKSKYMPTDDRYSRDFQKIVNKLAGDDIKKQKAIRQYISSIRMVLERNDWVEINEVQKNAKLVCGHVFLMKKVLKLA
jgi:hypothetical protein